MGISVEAGVGSYLGVKAVIQARDDGGLGSEVEGVRRVNLDL